MAAVTLDDLREELRHTVNSTLQGCEEIFSRIQESIKADWAYASEEQFFRDHVENQSLKEGDHVENRTPKVISLDCQAGELLRSTAAPNKPKPLVPTSPRSQHIMSSDPMEGSPSHTPPEFSPRYSSNSNGDFNLVGSRFNIRERRNSKAMLTGLEIPLKKVELDQEPKREPSEDGCASVVSIMSDEAEPMQFKKRFVVREELALEGEQKKNLAKQSSRDFRMGILERLHDSKSPEDNTNGVLSALSASIARDHDRAPKRWLAKLCCLEFGCSDRVHNLVNSGTLDYISTVFIVLNAMLLGGQTDYMAIQPGREEDMFFRVCEKFFCAIFTIELGLRFFVFGRTFFCRPGFGWNIFDCFVVSMQLVEEIFWVIALVSDVDSEGSQMKSLSIMRVLRVLRLVRVLRLARVMHLISELRTIIVAIAGSMRSLVWTLALLLLMVYIIGVYTTQLVSDHLAATDETDSTEGREQLVYFFGRLGRSLLTLYQVISGGVDWNDVVDPLMEEISWTMALLFVSYISFVVFALMNVVTGVFVESALNTAKKDQDVLLLHQMRHLLEIIDADGSGTISYEEFESQLDNPMMLRLFKAVDLDPDEAEDLFRLIDVDESGEILPEEFVNGLLRLRGPAKAIDLAAFMYQYKRSMTRAKMNTQKLNDKLNSLLHACSFSSPPHSPHRPVRLKQPPAPRGLPVKLAVAPLGKFSL